MRTIADPQDALGRGLAAIRAQFRVPAAFPPAVLAEAEAVAGRAPGAHADRTDRPFVTLDPARSTDLDQAFALETAGADILLHYAIADVAWFVDEGGAIDTEAWARGETIYLPDGKAPLHPPVLSERAASLLPDGARPAVVFTVRVAPDGGTRLDGAERAMIRSRAKLGYETVTPAELPPALPELSRRIAAAEAARGAARVDPPEQVVEAAPGGGYALEFRPLLASERDNAALSLAANLAVADALLVARTGLFRVMAEPDAAAVARLRHTAKAFGIAWPAAQPLDAFERTLDPGDRRQAALMLAIRRAGNGASYRPFRDGTRPWHAAMAATYAQGTAPLRRLADRYVVQAALAVANGRPVPDAVAAAFDRLPAAMASAQARSGQVERAVVDLAEAVMLAGAVGRTFEAVVTDADQRGARVQLCAEPVAARIGAGGFTPGQELRLRLTAADPDRRELRFEPA